MKKLLMYLLMSVGLPLWAAIEVESEPIVITSLPEGAEVSGDVVVDLPLLGASSLQLTLDGEEMLSDTKDVEAIWQPQKLGEQTLVYTAGDVTLTRTINVTGFSYAVDPLPEPPTEADEAMAITPITRNFTAEGGAYAIVTSGSGTWEASVSDASWISLNATSGTVGYPVAYSVSANPNVERRVGYVYVNGHVHTITQEGIGATVSPTNVTYEHVGGTGTITVVAQNRITWQARSNSDWIYVSPVSGEGEGTISYTVAPFDQVSTRQGSMTIAGNTVTVFQYGRRMKLASYAEARDWYTHVIPITVNALAITEWSVTPNASWISVVDGGNGKGGDTVTIAISENPSYKVRTGTVTIGTETFTVTQDGRTDLVFTVDPATTTASVNGANAVIRVTATPDLPWVAKSEANWLTIYGTTGTGAGNGNVVYSVSPQSTLLDRTGVITITPEEASGMPKRTHTVTQPAAESALSIAGYEFAAMGETCAVDVTLADIVAWAVVEDLDWLTVNGSTSRVGPGTVTLQATVNETIYPRSGTIKIAEKTFAVTQKARGVEVEYDAKLFGTDGGSDSISIHPDGNVAWTAVSSDPTWITIFQGDSGTGDAEIMYIVSPYVGDGGARTGTITVGDKVIYITQRAYDLSIEPNGTIVTGNNGEGEFGVSASIEDVWKAIVTEPWITIVSGYDAGTGNGVVRFIYTENNTGKTRTGKIIVSGEVYTIQQAARVMVNIVATADRGGSVSGGGAYSSGAEVTLTALPDEGYAFSHWTGDVESMQNPLKLRADAAKTVTAVFEPLPIAFSSVTSSEEGVTLTWNNLPWATTYRIYRGVTSVPSSAEVLVEIENTGFCMYQDTTGEVGVTHWYWIEAEGVVDSVMSDPMTGLKKAPVVISDITYENLRGATHTNPATYEEGTLVTFANPTEVAGYTFAGWVPAQITADMVGAQTVRATWTANTYSIAYAANGGSGTMAPTSVTYDTTVVIATNAFIRAGYRFAGWATAVDGEVLYTGGESVSNLTAVQNGVVTLYAIWEEDPNGGGGETPDAPTPPSWVAPENYQNNMTVYAQVKDIATGALVEAEGSLLAAFDSNGLCRGVVAIATGPRGKLYQLTVNSNTTSGEVLTLKVWNATTGETTVIAETIAFENNGRIGALATPKVYSIGEIALDVQIKEGWNWFSINLHLADGITLSEVFKDWTPCDEDMIKSATATSTYFEGVWYPEDFAIEPGKGYQIMSSVEETVPIRLTGAPVESSFEIPLKESWNWLGYTGTTAVDVQSAFADDVVFSDDDLLKSGTTSVTYFDGQWWGDLKLEPGKGYQLYLANATTVKYKPASGVAAVALLSEDVGPGWTQNEHLNNMTVYVKVQNAAGVAYEADGSVLGAFDAQGVCHGFVKLAQGPRGKLYQLTIGSDSESSESFTLKLWDATSGKTYDIEETVAFVPNGKIGSIASPQPYTLVETAAGYTVTVAAVGGTVTGAGEYAAGANVTLTATPDEGYVFCGWNLSTVTTATYTFTMPEEDVTLTAYFAPQASVEAYVTSNGLLTAAEADQKTQDYIAENNLMSKDEMKEMAFGAPVIEMKAEEIEIAISLQIAESLNDWQAMALEGARLEIDQEKGQVRVVVPKGDKKGAFYKFVVPQEQP